MSATTDMSGTTCVCDSGKAFADCCQRFLDAGERAKTPEQLMRSRYSAFALGGYGRYLLETWFPPTAQGLTVESLSAKENTYNRLEVIDRTQQGDEGMVEFKAHYTDPKGGARVLHERSVFNRIGGRWFYVGGEVNADDG